MRMITMRDPSLEHQITIFAGGSAAQNIEISCNCRRKTGGRPGPARYEPIETRKQWEAEQAWQVWEAWHQAAGIEAARPSRLRAAV